LVKSKSFHHKINKDNYVNIAKSTAIFIFLETWRPNADIIANKLTLATECTHQSHIVKREEASPRMYAAITRRLIFFYRATLLQNAMHDTVILLVSPTRQLFQNGRARHHTVSAS